MNKQPSYLEITALSKYFYQKNASFHALKEISLSLEKGDIFGMIGPSGAGKSTFLRCLAALEKPSSGQILLEETDIAKLSGEKLRLFRKNIGVVFQHFNLLSSRTALENVMFPLELQKAAAEERKAKALEMLHLVGLSHKKDAYPAFLSGGEKQRVGIARALVTNPKILLCDEATSALDPDSTRQILKLLQEINTKLSLTIFLITHDMEVIKQICTKVAVLEKGAVVETGLVQQVFADPKHPITKKLVQKVSHEIPEHFLKRKAPNSYLLRLSFMGEKADSPVISQMIKSYDVDANILLGWIDSLQTTTVGTLILELTGKEEDLPKALAFLQKNTSNCEILT